MLQYGYFLFSVTHSYQFTMHTYLNLDNTIIITYQYKFIHFCKCFDTSNYPMKYSFQYELQIKIIIYIGIKDQSTTANVKIDINRVY